MKNMIQKAIAGSSLMLALPAAASMVDYSQLTAGSHSDTIGDVTVSAWNDSAQTSAGSFGYRSQGPGVGVKGHGNNEIDLYDTGNGGTDSEAMAFDFDNQVNIQELTLTLLFNGPEYSDEHEIARIDIDDNYGELKLVDGTEDLAKWYVNGSFVTNVNSCAPGATLNGGSGCFSLTNPFGSTGTLNMDLSAVEIDNPDESDYLFNKVTYAEVPEPGMLGLWSAGLIGLALTRRRLRLHRG